jgi:hypothetical protein
VVHDVQATAVCGAVVGQVAPPIVRRADTTVIVTHVDL